MSSNPHVAHLMRRAGFGMTRDEGVLLGDMSPSVLVERMLVTDPGSDDVDEKIGSTGYVGVAMRNGRFSPDTNIEDARQRWLFRMVHTDRPLMEKMALFWHHHFATAYSKIAGALGAVQATKMMALKPGTLPGPQGQLELFRKYALGSFRDLLIEVARDPAMLVWLDGRTNTRQRPQENFGREIMELFTFGIGNYTEQDVYEAARVFTGWNLRRVPGQGDEGTYYEFVFNGNQHETAAKTFTFPIYPDGTPTIPSRPADEGMQDGIDFITALARHPNTARRLARKLWSFFVSEVEPPDPAFVENVAFAYRDSGTQMRSVVRYILRSPWFQDVDRHYARYSWPAEFVARAVKEVGWTGFSVESARTAMAAMGQTLFEPPDVNGWDTGQGWFSSGAMLARMNFASTLAANQRNNLAAEAGKFESPDEVFGHLMSRFSTKPYDARAYADLRAYLTANVTWTGSDAQLRTKAPGLARLVVGSSEYQLI